MADKQALNATFFAFRKRERNGVLTTTTIAYVVICIVTFGLFGALNFGAVVDYMNWLQSVSASADPTTGALPPDAMTPPASIIALAPMLFLFQLFYYVIAAAYEAACLRWMIRGETGGVFGFSFGADTWRTYFTYWIWFFLMLGFGIVFFVVAGGFIGSLFAIGASGGDTSGGGALYLIVPIVLVLVVLALLYVAVRLAPAAATSVARQRFAFFDAWKVTKGRFWGLFGAFFLLFVMYCVGAVLLSAIGGVAVGMGAMSQASTIGSEPTPEQMMAVFSQPQVLIPLLLTYGVMIIGAFVFMVALFGINARAAALALEEGKIAVG